MVTAHPVPKRNSASTQKIQWGFVSFIALSDKTVSSMFAFLTKYVQILCHRCICINKLIICTLSGHFLHYYFIIHIKYTLDSIPKT